MFMSIESSITNKLMTPLRICLLIVFSSVLILPVACSRDDSGDSFSQQSETGRSGRGTPRGKPKEQPVPVAVQPAFIGTIASYYNTTATLVAEKEAEVRARVGGIVKSITAEEGDLLDRDTPLLIIDNSEYRLRVDQAAARTANLQSRYDRFKAMLAEDLSSPEEYQAAKSELASAEADEGLARLNLSYTTVRAPFTGRITQRLVNVGQNLSVGDPLFMLADFTPLLAQVHVPSREFKKLQQDQNVDLILDSSGESLHGRIKLISPIIDPASGTIKLTVEVRDYPDGTRPGDFAKVQIVTERHENTVLVPREAVITVKSEIYVFVAVEMDTAKPTLGRAERRQVKTGFSDDRHTEILDGLSAGEEVVFKGQRSLKHGVSLKILPHTPGTGAGS